MVQRRAPGSFNGRYGTLELHSERKFALVVIRDLKQFHKLLESSEALWEESFLRRRNLNVTR